jgi:hypothetical protein
MPRVWLPDIEPEASNTTMASSLHGAGFLSSLRNTVLEAMSPTIRRLATPASLTM